MQAEQLYNCPLLPLDLAAARLFPMMQIANQQFQNKGLNKEKMFKSRTPLSQASLLTLKRSKEIAGKVPT